MLLYIFRHAEAEAKIISDCERRLTADGHEQAKKMGQFCLEHQIFPELILTSPVVRAKQTTEEFMAVVSKGEVVEVPWMACGMDPQISIQELRAYKNFQSVMIVGHEPDLSQLVAKLLGMSSSVAVEITKASLTALELKKIEAGAGVLKWLVPVELIHGS